MFELCIKHDLENSLIVSNESIGPIYVESSLCSLKTSQRVVIIQPNESSTVFEMSDFKGTAQFTVHNRSVRLTGRLHGLHSMKHFGKIEPLKRRGSKCHSAVKKGRAKYSE